MLVGVGRLLCPCLATKLSAAMDVLFAGFRLNGGPNCRKPAATVPAMAVEACKLLCETLWQRNMAEYWACQDVNECFLKDLRSATVIAGLEEIDASMRDTLAADCAFGKGRLGPNTLTNVHAP